MPTGGHVIRVVLADAHRIVREGIRLLLERIPLDGGRTISIVGEAARDVDALDLCRRLRPDVVVVDGNLVGVPAFEVAHRLRRNPDPPGVVFLFDKPSPQSVGLARQNGALAYLSKETGAAELARAIAHVAAGGIGPFPDIDENEATLSRRERQILSELANGKGNKEIAALLAISKHTVNSHRVRLMRKLEAHDVASLTRIAV